MLREWNLYKRLFLFPMEKQQVNAGCAVGIYRKVNTAGNGSCPVDIIEAGTDLIAVDVVQWNHMDGARQF